MPTPGPQAFARNLDRFRRNYESQFVGGLADLKNKDTGYANQKALEMMGDVNVILAALPDAGFQIGGVDVDLGAGAAKTAAA